MTTITSPMQGHRAAMVLLWICAAAAVLATASAVPDALAADPGAAQAVGWDGALTVLLVIAFVLTRGQHA